MSTVCCICCECCDCWGLPVCILILGLISGIAAPLIIFITSFMITQNGWGFFAPFNVTRIGVLILSVLALFFLIGFVCGYCGKKAWGRWMMFYTFGLAIIATIILYIVLMV